MRLTLLRLFAAVAAVLSGYLLVLSLTGRTVPGCDAAVAAPGSGGCGSVLASPYAYWLGVPVAGLALVAYAILLGASFNTRYKFARAALAATAVAVAGSAVWFTALQVFALREFCPLCLTAHALGLAVATLTLTRWHPAPALLGLVPVAALAAGQLFYHPPTRPDTPPRFAGFVNLHPADYPTLGPADAPVAVAYLYDPNCTVCRDVHRQLAAARGRYGDRLVVALMPVPFSDRCNRFMSDTPAGFETSCELARLSVAVWLADPDPATVAAFDRFLFEGATAPPPDAARALAADLVGEAPLAAALADPRVDATLDGHARLFNAIGRAVPRLIVAGQIYPPLVSEAELFRLLEAETALQSPAAPDASPVPARSPVPGP